MAGKTRGQLEWMKLTIGVDDREEVEVILVDEAFDFCVGGVA